MTYMWLQTIPSDRYRLCRTINLHKGKQERKAYILFILVYCYSLTRAVYMDLMRHQSFEEFLTSLQRFIACRGRPKKVCSDNFSTFVAASKWLKGILWEEKNHDFLAKHHIKWQFNLSCAPCWGSQFVLLDIEITRNNQPLGYIEDDIQTPILTPNLMILDNQILGWNVM